MFGGIVVLIINNIKVGQVIKNYKEFCTLMNEKIKTGTSKQAQLKEWSRYVKWHKQGNKFIIDEIYNIPLPKPIHKGNNSKYIDEIQDILIYYIHFKLHNVNKGGNKVGLSISELINILGLANNTYSIGTYKKKELSDVLKIEMPAIYNFYSSTRAEFKGIIERALNSMEKRCILLPNKQYVVVNITRDKHKKEIINRRCATNEETEWILQAERDTLNYYGVQTKKDIFCLGERMYKKFRELVYKELPFDWYYQAYYLICNRKAINQRYDEIKSKKAQLNNKIIDRLEELFKIIDKNSNEQNLINKLIDFKGYDLHTDDLVVAKYEKDHSNYYNKLQKQDKKINEENYKKDQIKDTYENKDIVDIPELMEYKYKIKKHNEHEEYWSYLLNEIDTYDI